MVGKSLGNLPLLGWEHQVPKFLVLFVTHSKENNEEVHSIDGRSDHVGWRLADGYIAVNGYHT